MFGLYNTQKVSKYQGSKRVFSKKKRDKKNRMQKESRRINRL